MSAQIQTQTCRNPVGPHLSRAKARQCSSTAGRNICSPEGGNGAGAAPAAPEYAEGDEEEEEKKDVREFEEGQEGLA